MNSTYRNLVLARVHAAVAAANALRGVAHPGLRGQLREIVIRDLLRPLLPVDVGLGTGEIVTATNLHSRQQDVVIYDRRILPPLLLEQTTGIFPIESVLYAIEVKSTLTAPELAKAHESAKEIMSFDYQPGTYDPQGHPTSSSAGRLVSALFAFDTDLTLGGKSEIERYDEIRGAGFPCIEAFCVVQRGYWYWSFDIDEWVEWQCSYALEEVVAFVAGVLNTYRQMIATRGEPRIGRYLISG